MGKKGKGKKQPKEWIIEVAEGTGAPRYREIGRGTGDPFQEWQQFDVTPGLVTVRLRYRDNRTAAEQWA